jgi:hypothetical protein
MTSWERDTVTTNTKTEHTSPFSEGEARNYERGESGLYEPTLPVRGLLPSEELNAG